ncbi:ABC transporter permease [Paenibacillus contaminans]|uniref:ABC transporter permease n=1 Tax=Paenibacillus contaminans TaxID=450362 RepID=A0A329M0K4_9BACL|nr:ABC transporter permease [Paenibacillus contaminans]RAV10467.1 ABC transporter permease [Paenibacillus contaminans]
MNSMWTVVKFTFWTRFKAKSTIISNLIFAVILTVLINLPYLISQFSSDEPSKIGVFDDKQGVSVKLEEHFKKQEKPDVTVIRLQDQGSKEANEKFAKDQIKDKQIEGYVEFTEETGKAFPKIVYKSEDSSASSMKSDLQMALGSVKTEMAVRDANLSTDVLNNLFSPVAIETVQISTTGDAVGEGKSESQMALAFGLVYALLFMLYIGVIGYGNLVATEITAEKSSRVMEVLISSVSPLKQMFGKIIGVCMLGLTSIILYIAVGGANLVLPHNRELLDKLEINLNDLPIGLLFYFILFYLTGYFIYATIFAAVGSLVSRTEEVGQAIMPVTFVIIAAFMISMYGLQDPNATFVVVMSFIPFFSPLLMFLRIGMSDPALWEIWLSIGILFASILGMGWLAAKIYRTGVLMYGKRPSFKELRKAMKAFKV